MYVCMCVCMYVCVHILQTSVQNIDWKPPDHSGRHLPRWWRVKERSSCGTSRYRPTKWGWLAQPDSVILDKTWKVKATVVVWSLEPLGAVTPVAPTDTWRDTRHLNQPNTPNIYLCVCVYIYVYIYIHTHIYINTHKPVISLILLKTAIKTQHEEVLRIHLIHTHMCSFW